MKGMAKLSPNLQILSQNLVFYNHYVDIFKTISDDNRRHDNKRGTVEKQSDRGKDNYRDMTKKPINSKTKHFY